MRHVIGGRWRKKSRARESDGDQPGGYANQNFQGRLLAPRNLQYGPRSQSVVGRHYERESKNSRDRRQLHEREISSRRVPKQVPRKSNRRHVHDAEFHRHPQERRSQASPFRVVTSDPRDRQRERRVKQRQDDDDKREHASRLAHRKRPILPHHVIKPRHAERVKRGALHHAQQDRESRTLAHDSEHQHRGSNPSKQRNIEQRKRQSQSNAGGEREWQANRPGQVHGHGIVDLRSAWCTRGKRNAANHGRIRARIWPFIKSQ